MVKILPQADNYLALPASPGDVVMVLRLYAMISNHRLRRSTAAPAHPFVHAGHFEMQEPDRIFNPSSETVRLLGKVAKLGPKSLGLGRENFLRLGRPEQKALYGLSNLPRRSTRHREGEGTC